MSKCSNLAQREYKRRNEKVATFLHWKMYENYKLSRHENWYERSLEKVTMTMVMATAMAMAITMAMTMILAMTMAITMAMTMIMAIAMKMNIVRNWLI